jgi:hypothetical protein
MNSPGKNENNYILPSLPPIGVVVICYLNLIKSPREWWSLLLLSEQRLINQAAFFPPPSKKGREKNPNWTQMLSGEERRTLGINNFVDCHAKKKKKIP